MKKKFEYIYYIIFNHKKVINDYINESTEGKKHLPGWNIVSSYRAQFRVEQATLVVIVIPYCHPNGCTKTAQFLSVGNFDFPFNK